MIFAIHVLFNFFDLPDDAATSIDFIHDSPCSCISAIKLTIDLKC